MIAKHDLPANQWPELLVFLQQHIKSEQPLQREVSERQGAVTAQVNLTGL